VVRFAAIGNINNRAVPPDVFRNMGQGDFLFGDHLFQNFIVKQSAFA